MTIEIDTDCVSLDQINRRRATPIRRCPFDETCTGSECRLAGAVQPTELVEDQKQEARFQLWLRRKIQQS
jgi:hypothetical protein